MKITVKIQEKQFEVQLGDLNARPVEAIVDGEKFEVWPEEKISSSPVASATLSSQTTASPAAPISANPAPSASSNSITAPIPGVITEIKVKAGDHVSYGQELCVLEAMKMKNSIRAGQEGIIASVLVSAGEQVQQGKVLMEFCEKAA